jgi:hypothetical protein
MDLRCLAPAPKVPKRPIRSSGRAARQMKGLNLGRYALSISVVAALLAGCGGQPPIGEAGVALCDDLVRVGQP